MKKHLLYGSIISCLILTLNLNTRASSSPSAADTVIPPEAASDLALIMRGVQKYRLEKGEYPKKLSDLRQIFTAEGFVEFLTTLRNPDDAATGLYPNAVNYIYSDTRPDGNSIEAAKEPGLSDVLAYTTTYHYWKNGNSGGYVVLRDSGIIEFIPIDLVYFQEIDRQPDQVNFPGPKTLRKAVFPSQPGVLTARTSTLAEVAKSDGMDISTIPLIGKPSQTKLVEDNGGPESLIILSRLLNYPSRYGINREKMWQVFDPAQEEFTLTDIQAGAQKLGLSLTKQKLSLEELRSRHAPAIVFLKNDGRIITLSSLDEQHALVIDRGLTRVVDTSTFARRYGGEALIFGEASALASLQVEKPLREIVVKNPVEEMTQSVTLSNRGNKPLTLQIEQPIPGVTEAELKEETLAPGTSAQLLIKLKWRNVLPGREQNDMVTIKTGDVIAPRLQLAFKLKLAEGVPVPTYTPDASSLPRAEDDPNNQIAIAKPTVKIGDIAPDFAAIDMNGKTWKLNDLKGKKNLLLTFFPKCFTGGCANHLSSLRDHQADFDAADIQILAVSVDPAEGEHGQKAFAAQWQFTFPLIPDEKRILSQQFGATQNDKQLAARMSILIDKNSIIRWIDTNVNVQTHGADVLAKMHELGMVK